MVEICPVTTERFQPPHVSGIAWPARRRLIAVVGAALAAVAVVGAPAAAHPFGPPPTAQIAAEGTQITVDWTATPDDAVAIGELLGLMPEGSTAAYRQESAAQVAPSRAAEAALSAAPELHTYLTEHIVALQGGEPCEGTVPPVADFVHEGARVVLTCPAPVEEVDLRITMLHEIHPAYRTFAVGEDSDPTESVFTVEAPQHTWRFGATAVAESTTTIWEAMAAGGLAGGAVSVVLTLFVVARRRRRKP